MISSFMYQIEAENLARILPFRKKPFWVVKISNSTPESIFNRQIIIKPKNLKIVLVDNFSMIRVWWESFYLKYFFIYLNSLRWANFCTKKLTQEWFLKFQNNQKRRQKLGRGIKLKFRISIFFLEYPRPLD